MLYGVHMLASRREPFMRECVRALRENAEAARVGLFIVVAAPTHTWALEPIPDRTFYSLKNQCLALGCEVVRYFAGRHLDLDLNDDPRRRQAGLRNQAIADLYNLGADRVLIVDPDEIWFPGALKYLNLLIDETRTQAHHFRPIPVVGCPAYPIHGSLDWALVYIALGIRLRYARGIKCPGDPPSQVRWTSDRVEGARRLMHLTLARQTVEEIRTKVTGSSHWGEKFYDFEGWLRDTLPQIRPGARDVSYFTDSQYPNFWPLVRDFTREELDLLPDSLKVAR